MQVFNFIKTTKKGYLLERRSNGEVFQKD